MKKIIYVTALAATALTMLVSCNDEEFLKEEPKTIFTKENAFEKSTQVDAALVTAYNKFNGMNMIQNPYLSGEGAANVLMGNGSDVLGGAHGASDIGGFCNYWSLQSTNGNFLAVWNSLYQLAGYANLALDGLSIVEGISEDEAKYLEGQARFFRGWAYMRLAEVFGGVPIVDKYTEELKFDYARATREETYTFAINDFETALAGLPEFPKQDGRVSKGIVNHFLAEAYLGRGVETSNSSDYTKAISAADAVIANHPMMTERFGSRSLNGTQPAGIPDNGVQRYKEDGNVYFDLFVIGNYAYSNGNTESLMIVDVPSYDNIAVYGGDLPSFEATCGPAYRDIQWNSELAKEHQNVGAAGSPWGGVIDQTKFPGAQIGIHLTSSWGMIAALDYSDEYVWRNEFADDLRNSQVVRWDPVVMETRSPYYGDGNTVVKKEWLADPAQLSRVSCKYTTWDLWGWNLDHSYSMGIPYYSQFSRDWYIARSAETYLLRAEAKLRAGDKDGAAADINAVRSRSHASKLYSASEIDIYTILDERARELAWEEMRWPTLLRMGGAGKNEVMKHQLENFSLGTYDVGTFAGRKFPEWTLFAIPYTVIALNSDAVIEQNPGWTTE